MSVVAAGMLTVMYYGNQELRFKRLRNPEDTLDKQWFDIYFYLFNFLQCFFSLAFSVYTIWAYYVELQTLANRRGDQAMWSATYRIRAVFSINAVMGFVTAIMAFMIDYSSPGTVHLAFSLVLSVQLCVLVSWICAYVTGNDLLRDSHRQSKAVKYFTLDFLASLVFRALILTFHLYLNLA